jgi:hypothetical protein
MDVISVCMFAVKCAPVCVAERSLIGDARNLGAGAKIAGGLLITVIMHLSHTS